MIFHSIKWRLQLWHGLILLAVLAGFGFTALRLERFSRQQRLDRELQHRVSVLGAAFRRADPRQTGRPPRSPEADIDLILGLAPPGGRPRAGDVVAQLNEGERSLFDGSGKASFYYLVWHREGWLIRRSASAPEGISRVIREGNGQEVFRTRGSLRELAHFTPPGECIMVGCDTSEEMAEMRRMGWLLGGAGAGVLVLGLAGGWWVTTRSIRPLRNISTTAMKISAGDLSQRIPAANQARELGELTGVLNATFARLEAAFAQQTRFTSDAAHELRTPVSVILTQAQTALSRERSAADYRETLEACHRAAQRMRGLIESLLELARLDAGSEPMDKREFDLGRVAEECLELIAPLAAEFGLTLKRDLPEVKCVGDADRMAQVVTNLLANAVNYNKAGGEVVVRTGKDQDEAWLEVENTGPGIPAEDLPHVFERFYQVDKSRTRPGGRTGLGLAIAKAIVDSLGGRFEAESNAGEPTRFRVRLPLAREGNRAVVGDVPSP